MPDLTLADFLLARIAEDEAVARAAIDAPIFTDEAGRWTLVYHYEGYGPNPPDGSAPDPHDLEWAIHATRHDPARVQAECEAKRSLIRLLALQRETTPTANVEYEALLWLASVYADHPDYWQEWKP